MSTNGLFHEFRMSLKDVPVLGALANTAPKVAVLRFSGIIADMTMRRAGVSHAKFSKMIEKAFAMPGLEAVAIVINSPGGAPAQASLITSHIRRLAAQKEKPVYAFIEDVAASGGYWLACAADEIFAQESSIVGSVGVISAGFGFDELMGKLKIRRRVHTSGREKSFLDPFQPEKDNDVKRLEKIQKDIHGIFIDWVKERRGAKLRGTDGELFEGAFWAAGAAMDLGLIDGMGSCRGILQDRYGDEIKFVELAPDKKLINLPFLSSGAIADDMIGTLENRGLWGRYGL